MKVFKSIISRIKWKSVLALILVLILILIFLWAFILKPFAPGYKGEGDIQIRSWVDPGRVNLKDKSTVWVDVRNIGKEDITVDVSLNRRGDEILFQDTMNWKVKETRNLGHSESREFEFKIITNTTTIGTYCIDIEVKYNGEKIPDEVCLNVIKV